MRMTLTALLALAPLVIAGCTEKEPKKKITLGKKAGDCDLDINNMAGSEWLYLRANADRSETPDHKVRLKFVSEDGATKAKYNVGSLSDMYTYNCVIEGEELICREEAKVKDFCQALVSGGAECTPAALRKVDNSLTDAEIKEGMDEADKVMAKYKGTAKWDKFAFQNNNLGNKLQGLLYAKVDKRNCRMRVTDNYMTIYNGKRVEDSNPQGTNPFVKNEQGDLLWEHCTDSESLVDNTSADKPRSTKRTVRHAAGTDIHFWYLGDDWKRAKSGCTYGYDLWLDGKPHKAGLTPEAGGRDQVVHWTHKFDAPSPLPHVFVMHGTMACEGEDKVETVACNAIMVQ
jgi:hypothetical protein